MKREVGPAKEFVVAPPRRHVPAEASPLTPKEEAAAVVANTKDPDRWNKAAYILARGSDGADDARMTKVRQKKIYADLAELGHPGAAKKEIKLQTIPPMISKGRAIYGKRKMVAHNKKRTKRVSIIGAGASEALMEAVYQSNLPTKFKIEISSLISK